MKKSIEQMYVIQRRIDELKHEVGRLSGWTDEEIRDEGLGLDMDALLQHLDNASGRASTVIHALRKIA